MLVVAHAVHPVSQGKVCEHLYKSIFSTAEESTYKVKTKYVSCWAKKQQQGGDSSTSLYIPFLDCLHECLPLHWAGLPWSDLHSHNVQSYKMVDSIEKGVLNSKPVMTEVLNNNMLKSTSSCTSSHSIAKDMMNSKAVVTELLDKTVLKGTSACTSPDSIAGVVMHSKAVMTELLNKTVLKYTSGCTVPLWAWQLEQCSKMCTCLMS